MFLDVVGEGLEIMDDVVECVIELWPIRCCIRSLCCTIGEDVAQYQGINGCALWISAVSFCRADERLFNRLRTPSSRVMSSAGVLAAMLRCCRSKQSLSISYSVGEYDFRHTAPRMIESLRTEAMKQTDHQSLSGS